MNHFIRIAALLFLFQVSCKKEAEVNPELPDADQYITWNIDGATGALTAPGDTLGLGRYGTRTEMGGYSTAGQHYITAIFSSDSAAAGAYQATSVDYIIGKTVYSPTTAPFQINVSDYGRVGGLVTGWYWGTLQDSAFHHHQVRGYFRLRRR